MSTFQSNAQKGTLLVLVLVFGAVFFVMAASFLNYFVSQSELQKSKYQLGQAREIAEAGLNYYKWYLAHYPDDVTHGTGVPGPYTLPYDDPELGTIGEYSLEIASSTFCGQVSSIEITSTGHTYENPNMAQTIYARYARPTVAEYAYIINSNVWAGADRTIIGPYHSNGGVRMDGTNNSTVTSGQATWNCTSSFGCSPSDANADGVVGSGPNFDLWTFPSTPINFTGLTVDLALMRDRAENGGGIYIPPSGDYGYRVTFESDGDVVVRVVDRTWSHYEYSSDDGWYVARNLIRDDDPYATYTLNEACPLIFVEDKVWLEGEVPGKVTIAAADTDTPGNDFSIILHDNITYATASSGLLAIAEEDVLVGYDVPNNMELNGIFIAQNGKFGRNRYTSSVNGGDRCRNSLTIHGTIVSNGRVGTKWSGSGCGGYNSGFDIRYNSYDRDLVNDPPPLAPHTSDDFRFIEWREMY